MFSVFAIMDPLGLTFVLTTFLGFAIYYYLVSNFNYWRKRGVNGPKPKPLYGNMPSMFTQKRNLLYDIDDIYREFKNQERFVGIFSTRSPQLLVLDPKLCQDIYVTNFKNFHDNEFSKWINKEIDPILGRNPFFLSGQEWKEKRAEVTPALTTNRIKASYPVMQEVCKKMTKYLERETKEPAADGIEGKELAARFTIELVSNCIYGIEAGGFTDGECKIRDMGTRIFNQSFDMILYLMLIRFIPKIFNIWKKPLVRKEVMGFFTELMERSIQLRKENKSDRVDFLNYLLQLQEKKNLSSLDLAAHTMTFFLDGFETSSVLISNTLHLLAEYPDVQKKLRDEINVAYEAEGELSYEKLLDLPYLDQCVYESLRLRPPAGFNNKLCTEECEIRTTKDKIVKIDVGTTVVVPIYSIHLDAEYYPNPEKFDPERFSPENGGVKKYKDMGVFLGFGDGPRTCLGMRFALCQSKTAIAEIVRNWEIKLNPKTLKNFEIATNQLFVVPEGGVWLDFNQIKN